MASTDELTRLAASLGVLWRRNRRKLPEDVRHAFAELLLAIRFHTLPDPAECAEKNLSRARYDVRLIAGFLKEVAARVEEEPEVQEFSGDSDDTECSAECTVGLGCSTGCSAVPEHLDYFIGDEVLDAEVQTHVSMGNTVIVCGAHAAFEEAFHGIARGIDFSLQRCEALLEECMRDSFVELSSPRLLDDKSFTAGLHADDCAHFEHVGLPESCCRGLDDVPGHVFNISLGFARTASLLECSGHYICEGLEDSVWGDEGDAREDGDVDHVEVRRGMLLRIATFRNMYGAAAVYLGDVRDPGYVVQCELDEEEVAEVSFDGVLSLGIGDVLEEYMPHALSQFM